MKYLKYEDGYDIRFGEEDGMWHCYQGTCHLRKRDGKPAAYKAYGLATKFMAGLGAREASPEPKKSWTAPTPAVIEPLEAQLAKVADAARFVVVEAPYGFYRELGYAVYDRHKKEIASTTLHRSWNFVFDQKWKAEEQAAKYNEEPPCEIEVDMNIFNAIAEVEQAYEQGKKVVEAPLPPAPQETSFASTEPYQRGDIIKDRYGRIYVAVEDSVYISSSDVSDLEDQDDVFVSAGWHTSAKLAE